jgi:tetratricopeptide (TPR) repeat protein
VPSPADIFAGVDRTDAQALVRRGNELYLQNRFEDAVLLYTEALKANPNDGTAHNNLGNAYFRLQRIVEATEHYREAVRINGNDAEAHQNLGAALAAQGDIDGAIAQYERALALRPDLPEALYSIGYLSNEKYTAATDPAERERWKQRAVDNLKHFLAVAKPELSAEANEARRILATLGTP